MYNALCCTCGATRRVSTNYRRRIEDLRTDGKDLAAVRVKSSPVRCPANHLGLAIN
jgi:hypothetical protein